MMKSFFKKLAFVMALAMVVSTAAPAATASAAEESPLKVAYQNGMAITEINLMGAGETEDLRFLGVSNWKELGGATWSTSNAAVATVDETTGLVTAVADGTAVVTVTIGDMTASVTVNVGTLPTYTVTIGEGEERSVTEKTLKVGQSVDFAFYGIKDYSRDKIGTLPRYLCTWQSDDTTVLTKDNEAGLFTAVKAGTAKVTLTVANVLTGKTHNVVPVLVTVEADATPTPTPSLVVNNINKTQNTFVLDFGKSVELDADKIELYRVFKADNDNNGDGVIDYRDAVEPYQHFYVSGASEVAKTDKTQWTVKTFYDFADGATYEVRVNGRTEQFVASVGPVAKVVVVEDVKAVLESDDASMVEAELSVELYDAKGVDVTTRVVNGIANNDTSNITYALTSYDDAYSLGYNTVAFYDYAKANVVATFSSTDGGDINSLPLTIEPAERTAYGVAEIVAWTLVQPGGKADWQKLVHTMPAGEDSWTIATLLKDTRGEYFTTHEGSAYTEYVAPDGEKYYPHFTENEEQAFWKNGLYVEYKAMNPDKMLIENFGEVASYEAGTARYALYLYNYNLYNNEFVKELYSQNITVCHERKMVDMEADASVTIMWETKNEDENRTPANTADDKVDAFYSAFSTGKITLALLDNHANLKYAKDSQAKDAYFETTLLSAPIAGEDLDVSYAALKNLIEVTYANALNNNVTDITYDGNNDHWFRWIDVKQEDYASIDWRSQVKFRITETTTGKTANVTINLKKVVPTVIKENGVTIIDSKVAIVKELYDKLNVKVYYPKYVLNTGSFTANQYIANKATDVTINGQTLLLSMVDKANSPIGYDSNLYISKVLNPTKFDHIVDASGAAVAQGDLQKGDRVLIVKGPNGKVYPFVNAEAVANSVYNKKIDEAGFGAPENSLLMGLRVNTDTFAADPITDVTGDPTEVSSYELVFRAAEATTIVGETGNEMVYAKDGRYTITILTVQAVDNNTVQYVKAGSTDTDVTQLYEVSEDGINFVLTQDAAKDAKKTYYVVKMEDTDDDGVADAPVDNDDNNGKLHFATSTNLKSSLTVTVKNNNPEVTYAGRELVSVSAYDYDLDTLIAADNGNIGADPTMKSLILKAFNFNLGDSRWSETTGSLKYYHLRPSDILYYTYTVAPSNNQIVINSVTFKVPVYDKNSDGDVIRSSDWYRSTATVNKSITFIEE